MLSLRSAFINAAWSNPKLRPHLLPVLSRKAAEVYVNHNAEANAFSPPTFRARSLKKLLVGLKWNVDYTWLDWWTVVFRIHDSRGSLGGRARARKAAWLFIQTDPPDGVCSVTVYTLPHFTAATQWSNPKVKIEYLGLTNRGDEVLVWAAENFNLKKGGKKAAPEPRDYVRAYTLLVGPGFGRPGMTIKEAAHYLVRDGMNPGEAILAVRAGAQLARDRGIPVREG